MTNFRPWRRECDNNTFIAIFMSVASRILQILWPNQLSTFWQCTENSICGTLIGCCCQNFSLKHLAIANMVMLQRDRMNNCREFRSSYGSDKQAFDILLQNIEQFCQGMQIRCKYEIQISSFTVGVTWSFNPDIEDKTFCLFWYETHIFYGQNKALLAPSDNKNLWDFD